MPAPMLIPFLALAAGIVFSRMVRVDLAPAAVALGASVALALASWWRAPRLKRLAVAGVFLWLGAVVQVARRAPPAPFLDAGPEETVISEGCVVEPPAWFDDRAQFVVELGPRARARLNLYVKKGEQPPAVRYGQRVEVEARFRPPRNFANPGAFDYAGYLARRDVHWLGTISGAGGVRVLPGECGSRWLGAIVRLRLAAMDLLAKRFSSDTAIQGVLRAALLGDATGLDPVWSEEFRRTSTYHVLVISGLHITTLCAVVLFCFRLLPAHPVTRFLVTSLVVWFYALLCGGGAPVMRAAGGATLFLLGGVFYRRASVVNLLAATGFVFLCADPGQLFEASFQLSFLAVGILGLVAAPVTELKIKPYRQVFARLPGSSVDFTWPPEAARLWLELRQTARVLDLRFDWARERTLRVASLAGRMGALVAELAIVSVLMQAALTLPMVVFFHRAPLSGFLANLIVTPLMTWAVPVGAAALLTGLPPLVWLTEALVRASHLLTSWMADWDPAFRVPDAPAWLVMAAAAAVGWLAWELSRRRGGRWPAAAVAAGLAMGCVLVHPFAPQVERGRLELTAIDVAQGDSLLLVAPGGETMLVDGGGLPLVNGKPPRLDTGEGVVSPYLWRRGLRRLDVVVMTHADQDHMGGLEAVVRNFQPRELWVSAFPEHEPTERLLRAAREVGARVVAVRAGHGVEWSGARVEALSPEITRQGGEPENNDSLVLKASFGGHAFLLTGDAERQVERRLVDNPAALRAAVLKLGHHGSRTSTTMSLLDAVRPAYALISVGRGNPFRHPHPDVMERLAGYGVRVLRTDQHGLVTVRTDGRRLQAETYLWPLSPAAGFLPALPF